MATTPYAGAATYAASIAIPDDAEAGVSSISAALEALRDDDVWLKAKTPLGRWVALSDAIGSLVTTNAATYTGAGDYAIMNGVYAIASGEDVIVDFQCMAFMTAGISDAGEYRLAYAIGGGAKTAIPGSVREFGLMTANKLPLALKGSFTAGAAGDLAIYIQARGFGGGTVNAFAPYHADIEVRKIDT